MNRSRELHSSLEKRVSSPEQPELAVDNPEHVE
jgi:hypothetical protein